jgi:hypothetical protein
MRMLCTIATLAVGCSMAGAALAAPGMKLSQAQCQNIWQKANPAGAATIDSSQAQGYVTNFKAADPDNDGTLSQSEFNAACAKGYVQDSASSGAAPGTEGADSLPPSDSGLPPSKKQF